MNEQDYLAKIRFKSNIIKISWKNQDIHAVYHYDLRRILAVSKWAHTVNTLCEFEPNTYPRYRINLRPAAGMPVPISASFNTAQPWEWQWDHDRQQFTHYTEDLSYDQLYSCRLVAEKSAALDRINVRVNNHRRSFVSDIFDQEYVYQLKNQQAELVLSVTDPQLTDPRWPSITAYAESRGISIGQAALEIKLRHDSYTASLLKTESIRNRYYRYILDATEIFEITAILSDFYKETFIYVN